VLFFKKMIPGEYDVVKEAEFTRLQLGTRIPKRLQELLAILQGHTEQVEAWHLSLFVKIIESVSRICRDLLDTMDREALPAAAWNARNLLELWVWITYCSASRDNAWRFHEDALRDMTGLTESLAKMSELVESVNKYVPEAQQKIQILASEQLGMSAIDSKFLNVAEAAKAVGIDNWYSPCNKHLSKFAHPTAGLVIGIMPQTKKLRDMQAVCTTHGLYFAGECVSSLEKFILSITS
jgi:hypothetical protein